MLVRPTSHAGIRAADGRLKGHLPGVCFSSLAFLDFDRVPVHGPYVLSELDANSFAPSSPEGLWDRLREFVDEWFPVRRTLADLDLDDPLVPTLEIFDSVYRMQEDQAKFHSVHAHMPVLGCSSEFVVIARASGTVLDIVTAQD